MGSSSICRVVMSAAVAISSASCAQAAFVVYDDFNTNGPIDNTLWQAIGGGDPTGSASGGTATITVGEEMRSTQAFPVGSTLRFVLNAVSGWYVIGTNSKPAAAGGAAVDAMFARNDTGTWFYVDGTATGPASTGTTMPTTPTNLDFVFGSTTLDILQNGVSIASLTRPVNFDEPQYFEVGAYPSASVVVDAVLYQVPEPGTLILLSAGLAALLRIGRRKSVRAV